ncbi:hypothetical protein ACLB2K_073017 [Fragaria x ananassa]
MCMDYSNLNRACPKDSFPLPRIDQLVDSTSGFDLMSFMDAYAGYNQIQMDPRDEEHTAFMTHRDLYYYKAEHRPAVQIKIENPQGYDELMDMAIRHAQADHDTYGGTSAGKRKDEGRDGGSLVQVIQESGRAPGNEGKLQQYVPGPRNKGENEVYGTINTIHGGSRTDNGRKRSKVMSASKATTSPSDPYIDPRDDADSDEERPGSVNKTEAVSISDEFPDRKLIIETKQSPGVRVALIDFLKRNSGAFASMACPKDSFPLPRIDQLVDSTSGFDLMSFMDAYAGYNQIQMDPRDVEHTAFTTDRDLYYYKLENANNSPGISKPNYATPSFESSPKTTRSRSRTPRSFYPDQFQVSSSPPEVRIPSGSKPGTSRL